MIDYCWVFVNGGICQWGGLQWRYVNGIFMNKEGSSTEVFVSGVFVKEVFVQ